MKKLLLAFLVIVSGCASDLPFEVCVKEVEETQEIVRECVDVLEDYRGKLLECETSRRAFEDIQEPFALPFPDPCELDGVSCVENVIKVPVTAYNSVPAQTDGTPCIAADGSDICKRYAEGELICASNAVPFGTHLSVEGYGLCTVADRMNPRYTDRVDVYYGMDVSGARRWGIRTVPVEVFSSSS